MPSLAQGEWAPLLHNERGVLLTGLTTQHRSGDKEIAYLRTAIDVVPDDVGPTWVAASSANRLDVWFREYYRGIIAEEQYIWADYLQSEVHPGAQLSLLPKADRNEIVIRVHGHRFAGGGMYIAVNLIAQ